MSAFSLAAALAGCFLFQGEIEPQYMLTDGNPMDDAIRNSGGDGLPRATARNIEHLLGGSRDLESLEALLTHHGATCIRELRRLRCTYRKTRVYGAYYSHSGHRYVFTLWAEALRSNREALHVCVDSSAVTYPELKEIKSFDTRCNSPIAKQSRDTK